MMMVSLWSWKLPRCTQVISWSQPTLFWFTNLQLYIFNCFTLFTNCPTIILINISQDGRLCICVRQWLPTYLSIFQLKNDQQVSVLVWSFSAKVSLSFFNWLLLLVSLRGDKNDPNLPNNFQRTPDLNVLLLIWHFLSDPCKHPSSYQSMFQTWCHLYLKPRYCIRKRLSLLSFLSPRVLDSGWSEGVLCNSISNCEVHIQCTFYNTSYWSFAQGLVWRTRHIEMLIWWTLSVIMYAYLLGLSS